MAAKLTPTEIGVFNKTRTLLNKLHLDVFQLVPPGGQAPLSLTYQMSNCSRKKTIYPDLIAADDSFLYIGELKPKYSSSDAQKLNQISQSTDAFHGIFSLIQTRRRKPVPDGVRLALLLIHEQETAPPHKKLFQIIFGEDGCKIRHGAYQTKLDPNSQFLSDVLKTITHQTKS